MIKSVLLTVCVVLSCWSQLTVAQSSCQLKGTYSTAVSGNIREVQFSQTCMRLKFESGTLSLVNNVAQCINAEINVYDMNNKKLVDLCSTYTFTGTGSGFYIDMNFGQIIGFVYYSLKFVPSSSSSSNSSSSTGTCGVPSVQPTISKIVGGTAAKAHSWPWQVYLSIKKGNSYYMCGGSLIDNNYVLTAAHCIYGVKTASDVEVYAGIHYASETYGDGIKASKLTPHEGYSSSTLVNDIALIKLSTSVTFNSNIMPVCLPTSDVTANSGIVTGWGATNVAGSKTATELMQVKIPMYPTSKTCGTASVNTNQQFCAGTASSSDANVKDSCFGDSGGPVVTRASSSAPYVIDGVVSYGESNVCNGNGLYTKVYGYRDWIKTNKI